MKKYIFLIALTGTLLFSSWAVPNYIVNKVPQVEVVELAYGTYTETVKADGVIEESEKTDLLLDIPIVPDEVYVEVGDYVEIGDVLATVDSEQTITALGNAQNTLSDSGLETVIAGSILDNAVEDIPDQVVSTASGVITSLSLTKGSLTPVGSSAATISNTENLEVTVTVDESDISKVEVGQSVKITGTALGENTYKGVVNKIYPSASTKTDGLSSKTVVKAKIKINNYDEVFRPGYNVTAKITVSEKIDTILLPYNCIGQLEDGREYVFCYENNRAVMREVTIGREKSDGVVIVGGLSENDIVLAPASKILGNNSYVIIKGQ